MGVGVGTGVGMDVLITVPEGVCVNVGSGDLAAGLTSVVESLQLVKRRNKKNRSVKPVMYINERTFNIKNLFKNNDH
ncbi:MAG: hypothetical protein IKJ75_02120 [Clostridia bacterium]|nr:hypothetical protein [Clostridia bacterium]